MIFDIVIRRIFTFLEGRRFKSQYDAFRKKFEISPLFRFLGIGINFYGDGYLKIGENSYMGNVCTIQLSKGNKCIIGNNCRFSSNVKIYTCSVSADADLDRDPFKKSMAYIKVGNVILGNGVWLGANVFIGPGITIGNNVVVGANSVVTKDLEDNSIYGGVPAKLIRKKNEYKD